MKEILLKSDIHEAEKIRYALDKVQLTGSEHIDAVLDTLNRVIKEQIAAFQKEQKRFDAEMDDGEGGY